MFYREALTGGKTFAGSRQDVQTRDVKYQPFFNRRIIIFVSPSGEFAFGSCMFFVSCSRSKKNERSQSMQKSRRITTKSPEPAVSVLSVGVNRPSLVPVQEIFPSSDLVEYRLRDVYIHIHSRHDVFTESLQ